MRRKGRKAALIAAVVSAVMIAGPAATATADDPGTSAAPSVAEIKLDNAARAAAAPTMYFGAKPLSDVTTAATAAANAASCAITPKYATALVIAMTWPEVSPSGEAPSPMTLSRYDTQSSLGDPQDRADGLWFHPGIGMWQLDSAGLGTTFTAMEAMDTETAANRMAPFIVNKYCGRINAGATAPSARASAWADWVACRSGACDTIFWRIYNNGVTPVQGVGRYGGGEARECRFNGVTQACLYVDPAQAEGADWWARPGGGRSPVAAPFYVFKQQVNGKTTEVRYWLRADSGAGTDVVATRAFGTNARGGLVWRTGSGFCDLTTGTGSC
ncbi:hypothetical protein LX16_2042 [Stackebrandtia albiflava]|uniref:Transglycosylase-like protein with SLT domain n=1 Tax=Stackebrandtia albiflava TaxID=406432 RepID=A0A562VEK0_9ACTN|nr:hypothetical protein [Stackebrandtia albiflava]TWJ16313.1 hypothetical protein LX16_2042 [Stackebrandtia albiflava]